MTIKAPAKMGKIYASVFTRLPQFRGSLRVLQEFGKGDVSDMLTAYAPLALVVMAFAAAPVLAQEPAQNQAQDYAQDYASAEIAEQTPAAPLPGVDESALLGQALQFDPSSLAGMAPAKSLRAPGLKREKTFDVSRTATNPDGSGTVVVKQALPIDWDAKVGADLGLAGNNPVSYQPLAPLDAYSRRNGGGAAWASIGLTDAATVDARVDPTNDQGRLAGTLQHSMPVGSSLSLTLQNSLSVTETYGSQGPSAPAGLPMMTLPQDSGTAPSQVFGNEKTVKFNILPTGTTLSAGFASYSTDPVTHKSLTAEQKLLGPLSVSTSVTDVGEETVNKSISARFKLNW